MFTWVLISIVLLAVVLAVALFNAATAPMLKKPIGFLHKHPRVSVLVPARNEEANIGACIEGFLSQNYDNFEIFVLDDQSTDQTGMIIEKFSEQHSEVQAIRGKPLPAGWLGKNWACHQLSKYANGEILIFTDADNRPAPNAIANTVAYMQKFELGLLSAFPEKVTVTLAEKLVVPVVDMFVYAGLPLWLTYFSRFPSLAAASGLWIAFTREAYQQVGGHQAVSDQIVEDVELSRLAKKRGIRILTSAGTRVVSCRMYHSFSEVWNGFSKNLFGLVRYKTIPFFILMLCLWTMCILPYITVWFGSLRALSMIALAMNITIRMVLALKYRHPFRTSVILHPLGILLTLLIGINSCFQVRRGRLQWKGRQINLPIKGRGRVTQSGLKIGALYLLLGAGGLWHLLGVFQGVMRILASPIMFGLAIWLFWECWQIYPASEKSKFAIVSICVSVGSFGIEWFGVRTGKIFGVYTYEQTLRPLMGGVPISIGCAWFVMLIASTAVAQKIAPKSRRGEVASPIGLGDLTPTQTKKSVASRTSRHKVASPIGLGDLTRTAFLVAFLMVCFDLLMEPAAVKLDYWTWLDNRPPLLNYLVWFGLSFIFATIGLRTGILRRQLPRIAVHFYFAQLIYFGLVILKTL